MIKTGRTDSPPRCRPAPGWYVLVMSLAVLLGGGCAGPRVNPSYPLTLHRAELELNQMEHDPKALPRPVVVLGGWGDVLGLPPAYLAEQLRLATGDDHMISIGFGGRVSFDECRRRVIERIEEAFPSDDPDWTTEVDVVGYSMGGLVARYAASPQPDGDVSLKRLRIARLYTISTPHRGALMAKIAPPGSLAEDMQAGSAFLQHLDEALVSARYPITPYVRLGDAIVGASNTAPHGQTPWWVPRRPYSRSHNDAFKDPRLIADIARRLRGETPYTTGPAEPVPQ